MEISRVMFFVNCSKCIACCPGYCSKSWLCNSLLLYGGYVVRPSFPMTTITSSMMMMVSCLVDPVGAEVANQSNSGLQHSSILGAWICRVG